MVNSFDPTPISVEQAGLTLAAYLRQRVAGLSWSAVRKLVEARRVRIDGELCLDPARRLREGVVVELLARPAPRPRQPEMVHLRYLDEHLVVAEKPSGINTVRHPAERDWADERRSLSLTLEDVVVRLIAEQERSGKESRPRLRIVQRLDKETSGLVVFARSALAERGFGKQFHAHTVTRRYLAVVPGQVRPQRIASWLVRDRGDGRRGSGQSGQGKEAITHVEVVERLRNYTLLSCRLETGRTHQIRIHLAELGHPVCGEKVYNHRPDGSVREDHSGAPRLALHAVELGLVHPVTQAAMHWEMPLPPDLEALLTRLRQGDPAPGDSEQEEKGPAMEIKWTDTDPETGQRRFLCAERFARVWSFKFKLQRRGEWTRGLEPTRALWDHVLDSLRRRYRRREGVSDEDIAQVERIIRELPVPRDLDDS
jgi:23S rRNA pseudouridine1911/1915/1917 synthase